MMARFRRRGRGPVQRPVGELMGRGLTRSAPASDVAQQIAELGGNRAVAERTGRSERTVRRWAQTGQIPTRGGAQSNFTQAVAEHRNTADFRQAQVGQRRETRMRNNGARFRFQGIAGPTTDSPGASIKRRNIDFHLSGDAMGDILDAYYRGGEAAAMDTLGDAMAREYMGDAQYGWHFEPSAGRLDFLRHRSF